MLKTLERVKGYHNGVWILYHCLNMIMSGANDGRKVRFKRGGETNDYHGNGLCFVLLVMLPFWLLICSSSVSFVRYNKWIHDNLAIFLLVWCEWSVISWLRFYNFTRKKASDASRKQRYHKNHVKVKEERTSDQTDKTAKIFFHFIFFKS